MGEGVEATNKEMEGGNNVEGSNNWANHMGIASDSGDLLVMAFQFMGLTTKLASSGNYSDTDIILDTGSTVSVFNNKKMLLNHRRGKRLYGFFRTGAFRILKPLARSQGCSTCGTTLIQC